MKHEIKRLFISDLPEQIKEQDLQIKFADYGRVTSLEIKERKNIGPKNNSRYFAYVNLEIDSINLEKCLKNVPRSKWKGYYVDVQIARENFLDRLKKEREENQNVVHNNKIEVEKSTAEFNGISNGLFSNKRYYNSDDENEDLPERETDKIVEIKPDPDIVIKDNRAKIVDKNKKLKIESVGYEPVLIIEPKIKKLKDPKRTEAEVKRMQSITQMKKEYNLQKNLIKASLSNVDCKSKNKIVFNDDDDYKDNDFNCKKSTNNDGSNEKKSKTLFSDDDDDDEEDETSLNFNVKEQFLGKKGQKLLQLQSRFKNDDRFKMDSRFIEDEEEEQEEITVDDDDKITFEDEKQKQLEILGEVLGTKVMPRQKPSEHHKMKSVLRFDPTQPEHSKFEMKNSVGNEKNKKKSNKEQAAFEERKIEENKPEVSKETFYKVTNDLKEALQEKESFSLLSVFGKANNEDKNEDKSTGANIEKPIILGKPAISSDNPFKYDSSDDEPESLKKNNEVTPQKTKANPHWNEMFFFKDDDYRFQEGFDFIKRLEVGDSEGFSKVRSDLKQIIKTKVRNNLRKNRPFKKKLGGNRNKKRLKIKKALKR